MRRSGRIARRTPLARVSSRPFAVTRFHLDELARVRTMVQAGAAWDDRTLRTWWGRCEHCGPGAAITMLDWSHYITRANLKTRWHKANTHALSRRCHINLAHPDRFGKTPVEDLGYEDSGNAPANPFRDWMLERLGQEGFKRLVIVARASGGRKQDYAALVIGLEAELRGMGAQEHVERIAAQVAKRRSA